MTSFHRSNLMSVDVLLNVLLERTDELDVFYRLFATQNTSASLYFILKYQKHFLHPTPAIKF